MRKAERIRIMPDPDSLIDVAKTWMHSRNPDPPFSVLRIERARAVHLVQGLGVQIVGEFTLSVPQPRAAILE
jgi:hypothetical protein